MNLVPIVPPAISTIISLAVALFTISRGTQRPAHVVLSGIGFSAAIYNIGHILFLWEPSLLWTRFGWLGSIALIPILAQFPDALLQERFARTRTRRLALSAAVFFLAILPTDLMFEPALNRFGEDFVAMGGPFMKFYAFVMAVLLIRIAFRLVKAWRTTTDEMLRRRVEFILLGEIFYCLCTLHDQLLRHQIFWVFSFPIVDWATLAFMMILVYATMRFRLIDIDVVLSLGIYYSLLTLGTAFLYFSVENLLQNYLGAYIQLNSWWAALLPAMGVALLIGPSRGLIQKLIDRFFLLSPYRKMRLFQSPNFQFLVLDKRVNELKQLESELKTVINDIDNIDDIGSRPPIAERRSDSAKGE